MGQSGSVELTTGHLQNNSGGRICGLIPQALCVGDSHTEKLSKTGLETMSALIRVSDPKDHSRDFRAGQESLLKY